MQRAGEEDARLTGIAQTVARNTGSLVTGEILSKLATLGFYVAMARLLGDAGFGDFTFAFSLAMVTTSLADWGTDVVITREVARDRSRLHGLFWNSIVLKLVVGVVAVGISVAIAFIGDYSGEVRLTVAIMSVASLVLIVAFTLHATLQAYDDMRPIAESLLIQRALTAAVGIVALLLGAGVVIAALAYLLGTLAGFAYAARALVVRAIKPHVRVSREQAVKLLKVSSAIGVTAVFNAIVFRVDATILSVIKGNRAVGLYGAAYQLLESTLFVSYSFVSAAEPMLARLTRATVPTIARAYETSLKVILSFLIPIGLGFVLFPEPPIRLLYGHEFLPAVSAVRLLGGAAALFGISYLSSFLLISQDRQRVIPWITVLVAIENVALNLALIPHYSYRGAAAVTSISELTLAIALGASALRAVGRIAFARVLAGPLGGCCGMAVVAIVVGTGLAGLVLAAVAYVAIFLAIERWLFPADLRLLRDALRRPLAAAGSPGA